MASAQWTKDKKEGKKERRRRGGSCRDDGVASSSPCWLVQLSFDAVDGKDPTVS